MKKALSIFLMVLVLTVFSAEARIRVYYLQVRECGDIISLNSKRSLQDKLNKKVKDELDKITNLHRVISIDYTKSEGVVRKNCALATVWYELQDQ